MRPFTPRTLLQRLRILVAVMVARLTPTGPYTDRVTRQQFWLIDGQLIPALAGGAPDDDDDADDNEGDGDDGDDADDNDGDGDGDDGDNTDDDTDESKLPQWAQDALKNSRKVERKARSDAKRLASENRRLKDVKSKGTKKDDKADEETDKPDIGAEKLRKANLLVALSEKVGDRARTVARLIDVDFDDNDEPIDLDDAIDQAVEDHGETVVRGTKTRKKAPRTDGGDNDKDREGPKLTADELKAAKAAGMTAEEYATYKSPQPLLPAPKKKE